MADAYVEELNGLQAPEADSLYNIQREVAGVWRNYKITHDNATGFYTLDTEVDVVDMYNNAFTVLLPDVIGDGKAYAVTSGTMVYTPGASPNNFDIVVNIGLGSLAVGTLTMGATKTASALQIEPYSVDALGMFIVYLIPVTTFATGDGTVRILLRYRLVDA